MNFSIYDLDQNIKNLLNIDNFLDGLSVNDFIEEISKEHYLKGLEVKNDKQYLDPKPYIRTFESTIRYLKQLEVEANESKINNESKMESFELQHSHNVIELNSEIESSMKELDNLDKSISSISSKINPLGTQLNKISNSRDRSQETIFLIRAYHGFFTKETYAPLENLRVSKKLEDKIKCAKTVKNLRNLAIQVSNESQSSTLKCIKSIETYGDKMESELLEKFEIASNNDEDLDFEIMNEIAKILMEYNEGINVIQTFVNNNDIIIQEQDESDELSESDFIKFSDPNFSDFKLPESLLSTFDNLKFEIKSRVRISSKVFDDPKPIIKIFITRIYAQIIRNKLTNLLNNSLSNSLAHVRILHLLHNLVFNFTSQIKEFLIVEEFEKETSELSTLLDQCFSDLFIEYIGDNIYFNREKKNLENLIYDIVHKFNTMNESIITNKSLALRLENLDNIEFREKPMVDRFGFSLEKKRTTQFKTYVKNKLNENRTSQRLSNDNLNEYTTINTLKVETVLKSVIESITRVLELSPKSAEYSLEILEILIIDFGKLYIGGGLEIIYDECKKASTNLHYLKSFNVVSEILLLMSSCIKKIILPCATNNPNTKNRMINLLNNFISQCELSLNIISDEFYETVIKNLTGYLNKQKKKDFNCDAIEDDTEACELISDYLNNLHSQLKNSLNGKNLDKLLIKIGLEFRGLLLEHFKKFTVNSIGGIVLTKDVIRYQSIIDEWKLPVLTDSFAILKEIGNLFTVNSNLVNSLITEGQLAQMKPYLVRQYISKRADFEPSYVDKIFKR
ncbi:unnamed protein product [Candida verbasci]|uniref:Exocyst complex component Sec10 n=1 Tax=Candida verbasci TaxID=1227364 RepID=A0A9W4XBE5_9ASCO|nr:unnamed protein product [Candida verbasci]